VIRVARFVVLMVGGLFVSMDHGKGRTMTKSYALALRIVAQLRTAVSHWLSANGRSVREVIGTMVRVTSSSTGICIHLDNGQKVNWVLASAQSDYVVKHMKG